MDKKIIAKFIYWNVVPFTTGIIAFYYLNKIEDPWDYIKACVSFLGVALPFVIVHIWIGNKIFKERLTLADKIMECKLRMQYGRNYCVKCADSYVCASTVDTERGTGIK